MFNRWGNWGIRLTNWLVQGHTVNKDRIRIYNADFSIFKTLLRCNLYNVKSTHFKLIVQSSDQCIHLYNHNHNQYIEHFYTPKIPSCSFALTTPSPPPDQDLLMCSPMLFCCSIHWFDSHFSSILLGRILAGTQPASLIMLSYENEWEAGGLVTPLLVPSFPSFTSSRL